MMYSTQSVHYILNKFFSYPFLQVKDELDRYIASLDLQNGGKKPRRESASVVDEFFGDTKDNPQLLAAKQMIAAGLARGSGDMSLLKTGLLNATRQHIVQQAVDNSRRESSSIIDDFFSEKEAAVPKVHENRLRVPGLQATKLNNGFDMDATFVSYDNGMIPRAESCLRAQSRTVSDSIWEDLRASINIADEEQDSDIEMDDTVPTIKIEDTDDKPSCQYQHSKFDNIHVKQENPSSCMLDDVIVTSNSEFPLRPKTLSVQVPQSGMMPTSSSMVHYVSQYNSGGIVSSNAPARHQYTSAMTPPHTVPVMMPPTPPGSQPGSPSQDAQVRRTPPPPYPGLLSNRIPITGSMINLNPLLAIPNPCSPRGSMARKQQKTHPGCSTIKYNRKNNPDLEKRRIHFCEFPGKLSCPLHRFR